MKILIIGSGGREHALGWRLLHDNGVAEVVVWPGNSGMPLRRIEGEVNRANLAMIQDRENFDLVIVGTEKFIFAGVADWCRDLSLACFAPTKAAARIEGSKIFSKQLMDAAKIDTARYRIVELAGLASKQYRDELLRDFTRPVIKISGPAAGKGVFVCDDQAEAHAILIQLAQKAVSGMEDGILIEERLGGEEVSMFFACHGKLDVYLGSARDYKRLQDRDRGPNTGGMGCFSPVPIVNEDFIQRVRREILLPTLAELERLGTPFTGVLFLGLMVDESRISLLEFNVRLGDPETQVVLPLLRGNLSQAIVGLLAGNNVQLDANSDRAAVHVVKASRGYPVVASTPEDQGTPIHNDLKHHKDVLVFYGAVRGTDSGMVTAGGRILGITALGREVSEARARVYDALPLIHFSGEQYRSDIGVLP